MLDLSCIQPAIRNVSSFQHYFYLLFDIFGIIFHDFVEESLTVSLKIGKIILIAVGRKFDYMLITKETDYALRILRALFSGTKMPVAKIAEQESIPSQFAYKILKKLSRAGYVEILRGASGGYQINESAAQSTLLDVICVVDGDPLLIDCLEEDASCPACRRPNDCRLYREFSRIQQVLLRELAAKPLRELIGPSLGRDSFFSSIFD